MNIRSGVFLSLLSGSGCSLLFDTDKLPVKADADPTRTPDALPVDSNPNALDLRNVTPAVIDEGVGTDGGRPALVFVEATDLFQPAISLEWVPPSTDELPEVAQQDVSPGAHAIGLALRVPVDTMNDSGMRTLRINVMNTGGNADAIELQVRALPQIEPGDNLPPALAARYSRVRLDQVTDLSGRTEPVHLRVTGSIRIDQVVDVDGVGKDAGPGGCDGGDPGAAASCGAGGGQPGSSPSLGIVGNGGGGGGGGYGGTGNPGGAGAMGASGGMGGAEYAADPRDMLVPLGVSGRHEGYGGGGGGLNGLVGGGLGGGGIGGGGGGVLELSAGGNIVLDAAVRAKGGDGTQNGSGGGGGSGGAILVRAGGAITSAGKLSAPPGIGPGNGGDGSAGRIRIDSATGDVAGMAIDPPAMPGPAWDASAPSIVRSVTTNITLRGPSGRRLWVTLDGDDLGNHNIQPDGTQAVPVNFDGRPYGTHSLCAVYTSSDMSPNTGVPEATSCIDVLWFP